MSQLWQGPLDSLLSIVQMPPGMPVATVGVDRGDNAGALAVQIIATSNKDLSDAYAEYSHLDRQGHIG